MYKGLRFEHLVGVYDPVVAPVDIAAVDVGRLHLAGEADVGIQRRLGILQVDAEVPVVAHLPLGGDRDASGGVYHGGVVERFLLYGDARVEEEVSAKIAHF